MQSHKVSIADKMAGANPTSYPCTAIFSNETPAEWDAHLIAVGADFFYEDTSSAQVGPVQVDVPGPSGSVSLTSPNPAKCVTRVLGAITVKAQNEDPQSFSQTKTAAAGSCFTQVNFELVPKDAVSKEVHAAGVRSKDVLHFV